MSFTIKIENIPDKDLGPILARMKLPKSATYGIEYGSDTVTNGKVHVRQPRSTKLTMTGNTPQKGTILQHGLDIFERLEARKGIGTISVDDFVIQLKKSKMKQQTAYRLIKAGFLEYLK